MFGHHHHGHDDGHGHGHDHGRDNGPHDDAAGPDRGVLRLRRYGRFGLAGLIVAVAFAAACLTVVEPGEALVVTAFGDPVRVLTEARPGPALAGTVRADGAGRCPAAHHVDRPARRRHPGRAAHPGAGLRRVAGAARSGRPGALPALGAQHAGRGGASSCAAIVGLLAGGRRRSSTWRSWSTPIRPRSSSTRSRRRCRRGWQRQVLATYGIRILQVGIERLDAAARHAGGDRRPHDRRAQHGGRRAHRGGRAGRVGDPLRRRPRRPHRRSRDAQAQAARSRRSRAWRPPPSTRGPTPSPAALHAAALARHAGQRSSATTRG